LEIEHKKEREKNLGQDNFLRSLYSRSCGNSGLYPRASFHFGHFFLALIVKDLCEETVEASNFARETSAFDLIFIFACGTSVTIHKGMTMARTREHVYDHELLTNHCRPKGTATPRRIAKKGAQQACYSAPNVYLRSCLVPNFLS
jgi:hypothetical protein